MCLPHAHRLVCGHREHNRSHKYILHNPQRSQRKPLVKCRCSDLQFKCQGHRRSTDVSRCCHRRRCLYQTPVKRSPCGPSRMRRCAFPADHAWMVSTSINPCISWLALSESILDHLFLSFAASLSPHLQMPRTRHQHFRQKGSDYHIWFSNQHPLWAMNGQPRVPPIPFISPHTSHWVI